MLVKRGITAGHEPVMTFGDAVIGLHRGDFSRLAPLFDGDPCPIVEWFVAGLFDSEEKAMPKPSLAFRARTGVGQNNFPARFTS